MSLSPLWSRLGATEPLFTVAAHDTWSDLELVAMRVSREGGGLGLSTALATVAVAGDVDNSHDQPIAVDMTPAGAALVADLCGNRTAAELTARWFGRIGQQSATDYDDTLGRVTTLTAADWITEATRADLGLVVTAELPMIVSDILDRADLPAAVPVVTQQDPSSVSSGYWPTANGPGAAKWSDVLEVPIGYAGNALFTLRDGTPYLVTATRAVERANEWTADTSEPLTRRQCLAPTRWEQPTSSPAVVTWDTIEPGPGGAYTVHHSFRVGSGARPVRTEAIDLSKLGGTSWDPAVVTSIQYAMEGLAHRLGGWAYTVPEVTVDLLELLTSPYAGDRRQAGQLLTIDPMEPLALSYDWPDPVIGLHYVTAVTEEITPDSWRVTLGLAPTRHITGQASPAVPGRTWDTAYPAATPWDTTTSDWDTAPL